MYKFHTGSIRVYHKSEYIYIYMYLKFRDTMAADIGMGINDKCIQFIISD